MNDSEQDNHPYEEEKFINEKVNETVLNIVTDVLKKLIGLEIDYNAIRESVEHVYAKKYNNVDLSDSMNEIFNVNTEDYLKNIMTNEVKENQTNKKEEIFDSHKDFIESIQSKVAEAQTKADKENPIADNENQIAESKIVRIKDKSKEQEEKEDLEEMKQHHIALKEREMDLRANQEKLQTLKGLYDIDKERLERINTLLEDFEE